MQHVNATNATEWLIGQGWTVLSTKAASHLMVRAGTGLTQYCVRVHEGSAAVGCGMSTMFLHDVEATSFEGGLYCISGIFPSDGNDLRFARRVIRGCGAAAFDWGQPLYFRLDAGEYDVARDLVALALMFEWDAALFVAGRRLVVETDNDGFPALIVDGAGEWTTAAMNNNEAVVTPWPFRSRFLSA